MTARQLDLIVRGGRLVTPAFEGVADIGIVDGRIVAIGDDLGSADNVLDATDHLVLPGAVDVHVHFSPAHLPGRRLAWADDFSTGTAAAAAGGVTTVGDICFPSPGEGLRAARNRVNDVAARHAIVDYLLHPVLLDPSPQAIAEIPELAADGATSLKIFMNMGDFDERSPEYLEALRMAGEHGLLTMLHCEDAGTIRFSTARLVEAGQTGLSSFPTTRPVVSEAVAVERAVGYCEVTGAPIYIVHLSSARALAAADRGRARGLPVHVETRPIYLVHTVEQFSGPDAALFVGNPPLREVDDVDALWSALEDGRIATCCTDHAPWSRTEKVDPDLDVTNLRPGMGDLELNLPVLFSEGVLAGRLSLRRFVEVTSTNAARLFGVFPRKGTIAVGSDADLVLWDPNASHTVRGAELHTAAGWTHLEGRTLTGRVGTTISRGQVVFHDGEVIGVPGRGMKVTPTAPTDAPTLRGESL